MLLYQLRHAVKNQVDVLDVHGRVQDLLKSFRLVHLPILVQQNYFRLYFSAQYLFSVSFRSTRLAIARANLFEFCTDRFPDLRLGYPDDRDRQTPDAGPKRVVVIQCELVVGFWKEN